MDAEQGVSYPCVEHKQVRQNSVWEFNVLWFYVKTEMKTTTTKKITFRI